MNDQNKEAAQAFGSITGAIFCLTILVSLGMWGCPKYNVYKSTLEGEAELAQANYNRQIKVREAEATLESSKSLALAEIERSKGVAQANKIIGDSLKGNSDYLHYLWIHNIAESKGDVIYIPTEAGLPILEAGRKSSK